MAIYARLENGTYAEVTGVYKTDGTEVTEIFQGDRLVYSASNEIYGSLPLYYNGKGYDLTDYLISGNAVQDGTPSPDAPVDAVGCGVRTANLFDKSTTRDGYYIDDMDGKMKYSIGYVGVLSASDYIEIENASDIFITDTSRSRWGAYYDSLKTYVSGFNGYGSKTVPSSARYVRITVPNAELDNVMLNLGSTALPYEPYGYKLPLTVNGTEYPIYLGQCESTRRIKKLVFDGTEDVSYNARSDTSGRWVVTIPTENGTTTPENVICTHFKTVNATVKPLSEGGICMRSTGVDVVVGGLYTDIGITSPSDSLTITDAVKSYLASQYANGTPVTVWYVLAEPETAVVNEQLMKIGDYADTVSAAQAGVTIPTVSGANVLDTTSPVKPSEVYVKGKGIKQNRGQS